MNLKVSEDDARKQDTEISATEKYVISSIFILLSMSLLIKFVCSFVVIQKLFK